MSLNIPKDFVLILTGVPCVGKTTTAYNLIRKYTEFKSVSEIDILRTMARCIIKDIETKTSVISASNLKTVYSSLFKSVTNGDFTDLKQQSEILLNPIREIVKRQQDRKIPTIIEGTSVIPSTFFKNGQPIEGFKKNIIFINLYLSDINEHIQHRKARCMEREYAKSESLTEKINIIRNNKNDILHKETLELGRTAQNVFSIDIAHMSQEEVVGKISKIITNYF